MAIVTAENLTKHYGAGTNLTKALDGVSLTIAEGEFAAIAGASGSGKSTLLHLLGGLDRPTSGRVQIRGKDLYAMKEEELTVFRRRGNRLCFSKLQSGARAQCAGKHCASG